jgi:carboxymethylenebutenolidase
MLRFAIGAISASKPLIVREEGIMALARRDVLVGLTGLSLAAVLADPRLVRAAAAGLETVALKTAGGQSVRAALAVPAKVPAGGVLMVHEFWGLNDQIKAVADALAKVGYLALAVDLYGGQVADDPAKAQALMGAVDPAQARDTLQSWARWLKADPRCTSKFATVGWCFGGGWALNAALAEPADGTIVYYGNVAKSAAELAPLKGPVLGHFATRDQWINKAMVNGFEGAMKAAGKSLTAYWYEADHAFANPSGARYDEADAAQAWQRTLGFLKARLG